MTLQRLEHQGAAPVTGLASSINASATALTLVSGAGYPTGAVGPFVLAIDPGTGSEEKVLCSSRSGTAVVVTTRGYDGTTATSHTSGTSNVAHVWTATEADDTNAHIYTTTRDDHTQYLRTDGSRAATGTQTFSAGAVVPSGQYLRFDASLASIHGDGAGGMYLNAGPNGHSPLVLSSSGVITYSPSTGAQNNTLDDGNGNASLKTVALTGITSATSAGGGAASALPGLPAGYLVIALNGGTFKIPYYNA
jgi:hypothetical protein